jgi:hypothetical protein
MKFILFIRNLVKNILWALLLLIIYFLIVGIIRNWWVVNYFYYLNARDWSDVVKQVNLLHPHTLSNIFYSVEKDTSNLSWGSEILLDQDIESILSWANDFLEDISGTWFDAVSDDSDFDVWVNVYDPQFEKDFKNTLNSSSSQSDSGIDFWFVNVK